MRRSLAGSVLVQSKIHGIRGFGRVAVDIIEIARTILNIDGLEAIRRKAIHQRRRPTLRTVATQVLVLVSSRPQSHVNMQSAARLEFYAQSVLKDPVEKLFALDKTLHERCEYIVKMKSEQALYV